MRGASEQLMEARREGSGVIGIVKLVNAHTLHGLSAIGAWSPAAAMPTAVLVLLPLRPH